MMTEEYVDKIINRVAEDQLSNISLRDDLIDHLCCVVETKLEAGKDFENAFEEAFAQTTPNGCQEIEQETYLLINFKKFTMMKKITYTLGFLFSLTFVVGATFKVLSWEGLYWEGADVCLLIGGTGNAVLFVPLLLLSESTGKIVSSLTEKVLWIVTALGLTLVLWFKFMNWQGSGEMVALAALVVGLGVLPAFFFKLYKRSLQSI
ncbi:hypothetical protein [Reichenbachiella sp.]